MIGVAASGKVTEPLVNRPTTSWLVDAAVGGYETGPGSLGESRMALFRGDLAPHRPFCPSISVRPRGRAMFDQMHETALVGDPHIGEVRCAGAARGRMTSASTDAVESGRRTDPEDTPGAAVHRLCTYSYGTANHSQTDAGKSRRGGGGTQPTSDQSWSNVPSASAGGDTQRGAVVAAPQEPRAPGERCPLARPRSC
jgi:hypothetical protein